MTDPNWKKLGKIANRAERLKKLGRLDFPTFKVLLEEAETASNGRLEFTDILARFAEKDWIRRLVAEEKRRQVA